MFRYQYAILFIAITALSGCHLLLVDVSGMPSWSCIKAKEPIPLFRELSMVGETAQMTNPAGMLNSGENARLLDHRKNPPGRTTHFLVRKENGNEGWFAWKNNEFTGWNGRSCW